MPYVVCQPAAHVKGKGDRARLGYGTTRQAQEEKKKERNSQKIKKKLTRGSQELKRGPEGTSCTMPIKESSIAGKEKLHSKRPGRNYSKLQRRRDERPRVEIKEGVKPHIEGEDREIETEVWTNCGRSRG